MEEDVILVCALADQPYTVSGSNFDHICSECQRRVMMAPSGLARLQASKEPMRIMCLNCMLAKIDAGDGPHTVELAAPHKVLDEMKAMEINMRRFRN